MEFTNRYVKMPEEVLEKKLGLKAVYMYAKLLMLPNKDCKREYWVTNPVSKKKEMSVDTMSTVTQALQRAGLICISKQHKGGDWPIDCYELAPITGHYKPVCYGFINHPELSADAKGMAILMCLLKYIPKSDSAIGKAIGISNKTVGKYMSELVSKGVYDRATHMLNEDCFPYHQQVNAKKMKSTIEDYEEGRQVKDKLSVRLRRQLEYIESLDESMEVQALLFKQAETGVLGRRKRKEDERKAREDKLFIIKL